MDDLVGRITRELPDTDRSRYDIAYERGRAQARSSLLFAGAALGAIVGGAATFLLDPARGRGRRIELGQRLGAVGRGIARTIQGRTTDLRNRAVGAASELHLPGTPGGSSGDEAPHAGRRVDGAIPAPRSAGAHLEVTDRLEDKAVVTTREPVAAVFDR